MEAMATIGHEIVRCGARTAVFHDADLWLLRHFAVEALADAQTGDRGTLKRYFERWSWEAPGVYVGTDLEQPEALAAALEQLVVAIRNKLAEFRGIVPTSYLRANVAHSLIDWRRDLPVDVVLKAVDRFESVALGRPAG